MNQPVSTTTKNTYIVPTTNGVRYVVASSQTDQRKKLLLGLLEGIASQPEPMDHLAGIMGMPDRKTLGSLLFKMQREGWLTGEIKPMKPPKGPPCQALKALLKNLSSLGKGVLADNLGCCIVSEGYSKNEADIISALIKNLYPISKRYLLEIENAEQGLEQYIKSGSVSLCIVHLHVGSRVFHLAMCGEFQQSGSYFVDLITTLIRQYPEGGTGE